MARKVAIVLVGIVLLAPFGLRAQVRKQTALHHFELPCNTCHESAPAVSTSQPDPNITQVKGDINRLCTTAACHSFDPMLSHPVGIPAPGAAESGLPLDENSRITCLTCHESEKSSGEPNQIDTGSERLLQSPENTQLCAKCHANMSGTLREQSHWQFSGQAHLDSGGIQQDGLETAGRLVADIDRESRICLSCHDDVSVAIPAYDGTGRGRPSSRNMTDHPIGVDYRRTAWRQSGQFKFLPENTSRIRLPNGQVGCGSCHSPYAKTKSQLVEPFERGILCRMCHNR